MKRILIFCSVFSLFVANAQNVGINNSSPLGRLTINTPEATWNFPSLLLIDSATNNEGGAVLQFRNGIDKRMYLQSHFGTAGDGSDSYLTFSYDGNYNMRLRGDGLLGIGTTTPAKAGLEVNKKIGKVLGAFGTNEAGVAIESNVPGIHFNNYNNDGIRKAMIAGYGGGIEFNPIAGSLNFYNSATSSAIGEALGSPSNKMTIDKNGSVGIGTTTPGALLEIKSAALSTLKVSSSKYSDTSQIILSNRTNLTAGTDMVINSIGETGLRIVSQSDLPENRNDSILSITPQGKIGINKVLPKESLDVTGNINYTQNLKVNGDAGSQGQVLGVNSAGQNEWMNAGDFKYSRMVISTTATTILVPAGVKLMVVEQWGAGGGGGENGGGASGCYQKFIFNTALVQSFTIVNGTGGAPHTSSVFPAGNGTTSSLSVSLTSSGSSLYYTPGGLGTGTKIGQPNVPFNYSPAAALVGFSAMPGKKGKIVQYSSDGRIHFGGDGGDAVFGMADGGSGSYLYYNYDNPGTAQIYSSTGAGIFGSGGGGGWNEIPIVNRGAKGGDGVTILRW